MLTTRIDKTFLNSVKPTLPHATCPLQLSYTLSLWHVSASTFAVWGSLQGGIVSADLPKKSSYLKKVDWSIIIKSIFFSYTSILDVDITYIGFATFVVQQSWLAHRIYMLLRSHTCERRHDYILQDIHSVIPRLFEPMTQRNVIWILLNQTNLWL